MKEEKNCEQLSHRNQQQCLFCGQSQSNAVLPLKNILARRLVDIYLTWKGTWRWKLKTHCTLVIGFWKQLLISDQVTFMSLITQREVDGSCASRTVTWHPWPGSLAPPGPAHALYTQHHVVSEHEYQLGTVMWFFQWLHLAWHRPLPHHRYLRYNKISKFYCKLLTYLI